MAEYEAALIKERTQAGLIAARARGRHSGRKPKMTGDLIGKAQRMYDSGSAPGLVDTRGGWFSGRFCGRVDHLKLGWGEFAEGSLSTSSVVLGFDPDHDRQA